MCTGLIIVDLTQHVLYILAKASHLGLFATLGRVHSVKHARICRVACGVYSSIARSKRNGLVYLEDYWLVGGWFLEWFLCDRLWVHFLFLPDALSYEQPIRDNKYTTRHCPAVQSRLHIRLQVKKSSVSYGSTESAYICCLCCMYLNITATTELLYSVRNVLRNCKVTLRM